MQLRLPKKSDEPNGVQLTFFSHVALHEYQAENGKEEPHLADDVIAAKKEKEIQSPDTGFGV